MVILQDFEAFSSEVVEFLVNTVYSHPMLKALPFVFVFGMSPSPRGVEGKLPVRTLAQLWMQSFALPPSCDFLNQLCNCLISSSLALCFSRATTNFLLEHFLENFCSVKSFLRGIRLAAVLHIAKQPLGYLVDSGVREAWIEGKGESWIEHALRDLPSVKASLLKDPKPSSEQFKIYVKEWVKVLEEHRRLLPLHINVFKDTASRFLPEGFDTKKLKFMLLSYSPTQMQDLQGLFRALRTLDYQSLEVMMQSLKASLPLQEDKQQMDEFLLALQNSVPSSLDIKIPDRAPGAGGAKRRDALMASAHAHQAASDPLRKEIEQWLVGFCQKRLSMHNLPLYEVFCCEQTEALASELKPLFRASIFTTLKSALTQFKGDKRKISGLSTLASLDLSTVFRIFEESTRVINISDWFRAFRVMVAPKEEDLNDQAEHDLQHRFVRCLSTLKLLGLLVDSSRGPDQANKASSAYIPT